MPPLPSTIQEETANLVDSLTRRQKDLQEFQIPRLRDLKGSLATQQQYAAEIREDLELFAKSVQVGISVAIQDVRDCVCVDHALFRCLSL
jgi:protein transport protein SEC20